MSASSDETDRQSAYSQAISVTGAYLLIGVWGMWTGFTIWNNLHSDFPLIFVLCFDGLIAIPILMMADNLAANIRVTAAGIERRGLWRRFIRIAWIEVNTVTLHQGRGDNRSLIIRSRQNKITLSNMRKDFWPVAHLLVTLADVYKVPVKTAWLSNRDQWFAAKQ